VAQPDPQDLNGPLTVAAVATLDKARIVVYGTSSIAANQFLNIQGNRDFFLNTVSWLAEEEDQISIRPKDVKQTPVFMSSNQAQAVFLLPIVVLPALVLVAESSPSSPPRGELVAPHALADDRGPGRHPDRARRLLLRLRSPPGSGAREDGGPQGSSLHGRAGRRHGGRDQAAGFRCQAQA